MSIQARISHSAIDAAIALLAVPDPLPIDTTLSERIRSARLAARCKRQRRHLRRCLRHRAAAGRNR